MSMENHPGFAFTLRQWEFYLMLPYMAVILLIWLFVQSLLAASRAMEYVSEFIDEAGERVMTVAVRFSPLARLRRKVEKKSMEAGQ